MVRGSSCSCSCCSCDGGKHIVPRLKSGLGTGVWQKLYVIIWIQAYVSLLTRILRWIGLVIFSCNSICIQKSWGRVKKGNHPSNAWPPHLNPPSGKWISSIKQILYDMGHLTVFTRLLYHILAFYLTMVQTKHGPPLKIEIVFS